MKYFLHIDIFVVTTGKRLCTDQWSFKTGSKLSVKMYNLLYKMYNLGIYNSPWLSFVKSTLLSAGFGYGWRDQKIPRTLEYLKKVFKTRLNTFRLGQMM